MRASIAARFFDAEPIGVLARPFTEFGDDCGGFAETIGFEADGVVAFRRLNDAEDLRSIEHF